MRRLLTLLLVLWAAPAWAATYAVKAGGGGDYTTIQQCATAATAGDTCVVYAGTYAEYVTVANAGSAGSLITFTVNAGDLVTVKGFTIKSYTVIDGFEITDPTFSASYCVQIVAGSSDYTISNNYIHECGTGQAIREALSATTSYGTIRGNTIAWPAAHPVPGCTEACGNGAQAMLINGDYHLIEDNDISHVVDGIALYGAHNVVRNNTFHDIRTADFPDTSNDLHVDIVESSCSALVNPGAYTVIEGNTVTDILTANAHAWLFQGTCEGSTHVIIRYNIVHNLGSYYLLNNAGDYGFPHVKDYHNTVSRAEQLITRDVLASFAGGNNGALINNLWIDATVTTSGGWYVGSSTGFVAANNLWYDTTCTTGCTYANPFNTSTGAIKNTDPTITPEWWLLAGSPARAVGAPLTTVAAADTGSGTSLVLTDAAFFQANPRVEADWIRIGTATTVQIASIDYATNTVTLTGSVTRSDGDPVYLYKKSDGVQVLWFALPDLGAVPADPYRTPTIRVRAR